MSNTAPIKEEAAAPADADAEETTPQPEPTEPAENATDKVAQPGESTSTYEGIALTARLYKGDMKDIIAGASLQALRAARDAAIIQLALKRNEKAEIDGLTDDYRAQALEAVKAVSEKDILKVAQITARHCTRADDENVESYANMGFLYGGKPIGVDFGVEIGFRTDEGSKLKRSGIVVGLRLDHMTGAKPSRELGLPKAKFS